MASVTKKGASKRVEPYVAKGRHTRRATPVKGARRKSRNRQPVDWSRWFAIVRIVLVVGLLGAGASQISWAQLTDKVRSATTRPVSEIVVQGEFKYLDRDKLRAMVLEQINGDFVDIDLGHMRAALERHPWVESVGVRRVWPDKLLISVEEETPIARWGDSGFISNEGDIVYIDNNAFLSDLPRFQGPDSQSGNIAKTYQEMTEMLASRGLRPAGISVDAKLAWQVQLENGVQLVFGQYDVLKKLRNFLLVYEASLAQVSSNIARVDMRYDSGMAVAWRQENLETLQASR